MVLDSSVALAGIYLDETSMFHALIGNGTRPKAEHTYQPLAAEDLINHSLTVMKTDSPNVRVGSQFSRSGDCRAFFDQLFKQVHRRLARSIFQLA